jgi:hypothetical protein
VIRRGAAEAIASGSGSTLLDRYGLRLAMTPSRADHRSPLTQWDNRPA